MDLLDKILLQHLPDTGLCERSKVKQARRRKNLREVLIGWAAYTIDNNFRHGQNGNPANMKGLVTKEGERLNAPDMAMVGGKEGTELIIDEMQLDGCDFHEDKTTVRHEEGAVTAQFKPGCHPVNPDK